MGSGLLFGWGFDLYLCLDFECLLCLFNLDCVGLGDFTDCVGGIVGFGAFWLVLVGGLHLGWLRSLVPLIFDGMCLIAKLTYYRDGCVGVGFYMV